VADIEMPQLGETVTEGTITRWFKQVGDQVGQDEVLFEVSTDKVDTEVPSPVAGTLTEIRVPEGETVDVGTVLAVVGGDGDAPAPQPETQEQPRQEAQPEPEPEQQPEPEPEQQPEPARQSEPQPQAPEAPSRPAPQHQQPEPSAAPPAGPDGDRGDSGKVLSPVVRRLINEYGIDPDEIQGSGLGGRISRDDVQRHIEAHNLSPAGDQRAPAPGGGAAPTGEQPAAPQAAPAESAPAPAAAPAPSAGESAPAPQPAPAPSPARAAQAPAVQAGNRDTVVPLSNIRIRTGEHMAMSKSMAPHTLTAIEVDYEGVERVRRARGEVFKEQEGFSLTYLPFISRAVIDALREYPHLNASVGDRELVVHNDVNLGIAVDLDFQGLLAPVVRGADGKRMRAIARDVNDLARRARSKQLSPDELAGGTFTLTNAGSYGTMMQFPIINQPQVAILSTDGVKRKPVVITDQYGNENIGIHSVGVLALAWDHRAIDGAYAAAFLARVKDIIETRDWEPELT
jgi:pyruvate dehydrogenase E2 component (dihydrolipoamide acetyltransferase)